MKTYTMKGDAEHPGLIPLAMRHVFAAVLHRLSERWLLRVSYLEIYNERVRDLLHPGVDDLKVHVSRERGVHVEPREEVVRSVEEVLALLEEGERHRHYGQTLMNDFSSRSHTIFRLVIENKPQPRTASPEPPPPSASASASSTSFVSPAVRRKEKVRVSVLNFVDLAGSERQAQTQAQGSRLREALFINKSLLNLGIVIAKLGEGRGGHGEVPYRDSKLTHILSSSLGGNSRVVIVCAISAAVVNSEHSVNTLRFGGRCARVRQCATVNEVSGDEAEINRYEGKIRQLQNRLSVLPAHSSLVQPVIGGEHREVEEAKEDVRQERRLLAEDRLKVEEERLRLEQQIASFKDLIMTATHSGLAPASHSSTAQRRRRATFGDGRSSGEWGKAADAAEGVGERAVAAGLSEAQDEFFRGEQRERKVASLEQKVERLEDLLKELSQENSALMKDNEDMESDVESLTARMEELVADRQRSLALLTVEQTRRRRWEDGEGVDSLTNEELAAMKARLDDVRRRVERQILWREFCKARGDASADEAPRLERERALAEEVAALRERAAKDDERREKDEREHQASVEQLTATNRRLQEDAEQHARLVEEAHRALQGLTERTAQLDGERAQWESRCGELEGECRRVREENAEYSRRLLDVMRPPVIAPTQPGRLVRDASSHDGFSLLPSVTYASYVPPSPNDQPAQSPVLAASPSPASTPMMSAHVPTSSLPVSSLPALSLDELMGQQSAGQSTHGTAWAAPSHSSPQPLHDITTHAMNAAYSTPARAETPTFSRPPSPSLHSAGKSANKPTTNAGSAGKRPAAPQARRK